MMLGDALQRAGGRPLARPIARLQSFAHDKEARIIGLTSNSGGSGVSMLSRELAQSFANLGRRTVLVDASRLSIEQNALADERGTTFDLLQAARKTNTGVSTIDLAEFEAVVQAGKRAYREMFRKAAASGVTLIVDLAPTTDVTGDISPGFLATGAACDLVFLVCLSGVVSKVELGDAVEACKLNSVPLGGVIVNDWKLPIAGLLGDN